MKFTIFTTIFLGTITTIHGAAVERQLTLEPYATEMTLERSPFATQAPKVITKLWDLAAESKSELIGASERAMLNVEYKEVLAHLWDLATICPASRYDEFVQRAVVGISSFESQEIATKERASQIASFIPTILEPIIGFYQTRLYQIQHVQDELLRASGLVQFTVRTLASTNEILARMQQLAAQSNSSTLGVAERAMLDLEYQELMAQINNNAGVEWCDTPLFKDDSVSYSFETGIGKDSAIGVNFTAATADALNLCASNVLTIPQAVDAATRLTGAIHIINMKIASLGAKKSRIHYVIDFLNIQREAYKDRT